MRATMGRQNPTIFFIQWLTPNRRYGTMWTDVSVCQCGVSKTETETKMEMETKMKMETKRCANCGNKTENVNLICDLCTEMVSYVRNEKLKRVLKSDIRMNKSLANHICYSDSETVNVLDTVTEMIRCAYRIAFLSDVILVRETIANNDLNNGLDENSNN